MLWHILWPVRGNAIVTAWHSVDFRHDLPTRMLSRVCNSGP
jgi:hypothetical protein